MLDIDSAERRVRELHALYTDAVWRKDIDAFVGCFTQECEWRISGNVFRGHEQVHSAMAGIMDRFHRVLISFRTPMLSLDGEELTARTYVDEQCSWKNGERNMNIGCYYDRFAEEDGRLRFSWRLFELFYRGPPDLSGTYYDTSDHGAPPAMPPRNAETPNVSSA